MAYKSHRTIMLEYIPLRILMEIMAIMPYIVIILFAKLVGTLMYYFAPSARRIALINLKQAFPNKSFHETKKDSQAFYEVYDYDFCRVYKIFKNV